MDEMIFKLGSKLMRSIITKIIIKYVKKQFGVDIKLDLDELNINYLDGDVNVRTNLELKLNRNDMKRILSKIEEDI